MGNVYYRLRDYPNAKRSWTKIASAWPERWCAEQTLFDLAVEFNNPQDIQASADELRKMVGPQNTVYKYVLATQIVWKIRNEKGAEGALCSTVRDGWSRKPAWFAANGMNWPV